MKKLVLILLFIPLVSIGQTLTKKISETDFSIGKSIKMESTKIGRASCRERV